MTVKPIKPIMTEEELELKLDDEDVIEVNVEVPMRYQVLVTEKNSKGEETGFYWRSTIYKNKDDAIAYACLLEKKTIGCEFNTNLFLVQVIEVSEYEDEEIIYTTEII